MAEGKEGRKRVANTMKLGVEWLYQFTDAGKLSFRAFLYYLEGVLVPSDVPEEVLNGVIERGEEKAQEISEGSKQPQGPSVPKEPGLG